LKCQLRDVLVFENPSKAFVSPSAMRLNLASLSGPTQVSGKKG
jgi:hypothetical protein